MDVVDPVYVREEREQLPDQPWAASLLWRHPVRFWLLQGFDIGTLLQGFAERHAQPHP